VDIDMDEAQCFNRSGRRFDLPLAGRSGVERGRSDREQEGRDIVKGTIRRLPATRRSLAALSLTTVLALCAQRGSASASPTLTEISTDPFNAPTIGQHHSEVEPDTFAFGNSEVAVFQVGRISDGGATTAGWATYSNGAWQNGLLPALTTNQNPAGSYPRVSDPSVAYDAKHGVWLASTLAISGPSGDNVLVNRSSDGLTWSSPVQVLGGSHASLDKDWIVCDDTSSSPYYGNCYSTWDDVNNNYLPQTSTSTDGGLHWGAPVAPAPTTTPAEGLGGQPLVQPNGTLIVPLWADNQNAIDDYVSSNGGTSYSSELHVGDIANHANSGGLRTEPLPSAEMDSSGRVYVVWQDCSFRASCSSNDIVMSTSTDGVAWTPKTRIPIDPVNSTVDHFIPGIGVDRTTSGASAHLALTYYYYPDTSCTAATCQLDVGAITSNNGGASWSAPQQLAGPMMLSWLPNAGDPFVGDYISTSFLNTVAMPVFAVATAPNGGVLDQGMYSTAYTVGNPTVARISRLSIHVYHGVSSLRWYAAGSITGFNVYDGSIKINRRLVTSPTHWYHFATRSHLRHVRILAVRP